MFDEEDEDYKKKKERARLLRNSVGMITPNDKKNMNSNNEITTTNNNDYVEKLNRARKLRNSVGMITLDDMNYVQQKENLLTVDKKQDNIYVTNSSTNIDMPNDYEQTSISNDVMNSTTEHDNVVDSSSKNRKEVYNVIANNNKPSSLVTDEEKQVIEYTKQHTNSDKNLFSQFGKMIENLWLGITSGSKQYAKTATETSYPKEREYEMLIGNNKNVPTIVKEEYKQQINKNNILTAKTDKSVQNARQFSIKFNPGNIYTKSLLNDEQSKQLNNTLNEYKVVYGEIELNPATRNLTKSIQKDENRIASNVNEISNPLIKKIATLAPSTGNSLAGAAVSSINPYLGMQYFMVSAMGSYEDDARNRGMTKEEARAYGKLMGWFEGATEMIGIDKLLSSGKSLSIGMFKQALKDYGINMVDNAIQEAVIDPIDELVAGGISGKTKNDYSTLEGGTKLLKDMVQDGIDGALSSLLLNGVSAGVNSAVLVYNKINNGQRVTQEELKRVYEEMQKEGIDVNQEFKDSFDYQKNKLLNENQGIYNTLDFDQDGNITSMRQAPGEKIGLINDKFNIEPVVVDIDGNYNVIDNTSGLKLDTTMYDTKQDAIDGFNQKIANANDVVINSVNDKVRKAKLAISNKMNEISNYMVETENASKTTNSTLDDVNKLTSQISNDGMYTAEHTNNIMDFVSSNIKNIHMIEQSGNMYLNSLDKNGNLVYQQNIPSKNYTGAEIKEIINNAVQNADMSNETMNMNGIQANVEQDTDNLNIKPINYAYNNENGLKMEDRTSKNVANKNVKPYQEEHPELATEIQEMAWNFQEDLANSAPGERYKAGDKWTGQKRSTTKELAQIKDETGASWDRINQALEDIANNNGNYALAKKIELVLDKALTEGYTNIYGKTVFPNESYLDKKGNIEGIDYKNTNNIYDVTQYMTDEELRPFGEKMNKKSNNISNTELKRSIENFKKANKNVRRQDVLNVANSLNIKLKPGAVLINDTNMSRKAGHNPNPSIINITKIFENVNNKNAKEFREDAIEEAMSKFRDAIVTIEDTKTEAEINRKGIEKTFSGNVTEEKIQTADNIKDIIEQGIYGFTSHNPNDNTGILYHHFFAPVNYKDNNGLVRIVIKEYTQNKTMNDKFYYHQLEYIDNNKIKDISSALPRKSGSKDFEPISSIDNSISQKNKNVKNNTAINKQSMQKEENNTSNVKNTELSKIDPNIQKELHNRIQNAIISRNSRGRTYLGNVSTKIANKIKEMFGFEISDRRHVLADNDIRHMIKEHGNPEIEKTKGQIAITVKDIEKIPDIINNYDKILQGNDNREGKTIRYVKNYSDNISYVVEVIPEKGNALKIKTMWKKPVRVTNSQKTPSSTSETKSGLGSTTSNISITQNEENVKDENVRFMKINTSNDDIRYMKSNSNTTKSTNATNKNTKNTRKDDIVKSVDTQIYQDKYQDNLLNIDNDVAKTNAEGADRWIEKEIQKVEQTNSWDNTIPVTKRSDIRKTIEDYLGLNIKKGHFRQKAYGIYKPTRDVIRVKEYKDMDNILHEAGHAMDLGNRINIDKESIANELFTAIDKHGGYEKESRTVRLDEGFAEVIREYTIVPEQAKKDYPQSVAVLEGIRKQDQSFDNFIKKVQQQTYNYIHQNPRNRTLSNMSVGERTDKRKWSKEWISQEVMRNIYDKDYALKKTVSDLQEVNGKTFSQLKASDNAYYLTRLSSGIGNKIISMLSDGYIDENGNQLMPGLNKIGEILGNNLERFNDLRAYLVAQRDLEYKAKTLKTGIRTMDSKAVVNQFKNDAQIQEAAKLIYDTIDGVMQYAVNNGLITEEQALSLKNSNAFYVPMQRVLEGNKNNVGRRGAVTDIIKKRTGSELDVKDILENIITNSSNIIQQVENNNILRALYKQGEASGLTGAVYDVISTPMTKIGTTKLSTWKKELKNQGVNTNKLDLEKTIDLFAPDNKVDSKNLITSFIDETGKRVYLQFNDDVLFNSIMNMDKEFMSKVLKINRKLNMPLRYGATMANIGFAIPNMISDTAQAAIYSTAGFVPVIDNALGVMDILSATNPSIRSFVNKFAPGYADKINRLYTLYQQTGATSATRLSQYRESSQNVMKDVYGTKKSENLGIQEKYKPLKRLLDLMTYIPEISEQSTRFKVFEKNYDYYKNKGNSEMDARIMAALESRDATQDFGRMGNFTREINQLIPFSAARVGSAYTFAEKVKANPKQVGMRIAVLTAIAMTIKAIGYDDDEIDELNQRKKDDNFVLKIGDQVVTVKKPQGILRSMINLSEYIQDLATGHIEEGKEGERLGEWLNNTIIDNMPADEAGGYVANAVAPIIENWANKDFYYNTDIVKSYDLDLPDKDQYYDYNSQLAIWLGQAFNYSPAKIDNLISGYFGGLGTQVTGIIDYISGKVGLSPEKPEMGAETDAVGKRFVVNVNTNSASIDEIYKLETELTKKQNGGTITSKEEKQLETIKSAINNMSKVNKQIKEIKKDLTMSGEEKAEKIKELQKQKTDTARQALGKDLIYPENEQKIESSQFYPSQNSLKNNGYILNMSSEQKKEYEQLASEYYSKYEKQGLYSEEKLKDIKSKAKEYAKSYMMQKYRTDLIKTK